MSRKRRKRPIRTTAIIAPEAKKDVAQKATSAQDGFTNSLAYLGEASALNKANDYERHDISNEFELLTVMYRENWLAARIIDTPCEDMTRAWYSLSSEIDQEKLDELAKLESKHSVKQEITNAIRWGRLYGGAAAVMVIKGQEDMLDQPMDYDMLQPGCFRGLIVVDRKRGIFPSLELEEDMDDPEFGYPRWYDVILNEETGAILRIHHSRLLMFRGRQLPIDEEINADYWGASEIEHVYEELQKRNSSSANIAQLIFQANVAAIKMSDFGEVLGMGTPAQRQQVYHTVEEMNRLKTSFGMMLLSNEDSFEQHPYSFAGLSEVYEAFMMDMAGAAEIPATKLFGRAPQGMNATGESDMKNYYEMISQLQERILKPALEKLIPVMAMSLWGEIPEDLEIVFEPLGSTTPSERAEIMGQFANPIIQAFSAGLISQKTALKELRETGKPVNAWTNITDEDIENAEDQVDTGEMDPMMGGMPGMPGMPPEGPQGPEGMPPEPPPEEMPEEDPSAEMMPPEQPMMTEEVPEDKDDEIDDTELLRRAVTLAVRSGDIQAAKEVVRAYRNRNNEVETDGGPGSGPRPGYHKKHTLLGGLFNKNNPAQENVAQKATKQTGVQNVAQKATTAPQAQLANPVKTQAQPSKPTAKTQAGLANPSGTQAQLDPKQKTQAKFDPKTGRPINQARKKKPANPYNRRDKNPIGFKNKARAIIGGLASGVATSAAMLGNKGVHGGPGGGGGSGGGSQGEVTSGVQGAAQVNTPEPSEVKAPDFTNEIYKHTTGEYKGPGNIDLNNRQVVRNPDGSISTEKSFSTRIDGKEVLLPTIVNGKEVSEKEAIQHYMDTGEHLGKFDTPEEATKYAEALHNRQDWYYNQKQPAEQKNILRKQRNAPAPRKMPEAQQEPTGIAAKARNLGGQRTASGAMVSGGGNKPKTTTSFTAEPGKATYGLKEGVQRGIQAATGASYNPNGVVAASGGNGENGYYDQYGRRIMTSGPENAPYSAQGSQAPAQRTAYRTNGNSTYRKEAENDGGPGSGPRPGYHKKASLAERVKFLTNPVGENAPSAPRTAESVNRANKEREEWSNLTTHQKIAGSAKQDRHIRKVKTQVAKAAAKGDIDEAKRIVKSNRHYWSNDPDSAMKVQSETLKRQKAEKKGLF